MADLNKDFKIDRNSFQEILASAFLVQQSKLDKEFVNTVAEIEQLMEKDHFSVDTIADLPVEESPEVPISEGDARNSLAIPTYLELKNWKLPFPSTLFPITTHSLDPAIRGLHRSSSWQFCWFLL